MSRSSSSSRTRRRSSAFSCSTEPDASPATPAGRSGRGEGFNRVVRLAIAVAVTATILLIPPTAWAASYPASLRAAVAHLTVASEIHIGYGRDLFRHWIDAGRAGCKTGTLAFVGHQRTK
jgi:hypothetical protein